MNNLSIRKMTEVSKKKKKGFTLIELIIVIAIIAVLAAIAIPKFGAVKENSNKAADISTAKNISLAVSKAIADGNISYTTAISGATLSSVGSYDLTKELDGITATTTLKTSVHKSDSFVVSVDTSGNVRVCAGSDAAANEVYPGTAAAFK